VQQSDTKTVENKTYRANYTKLPIVDYAKWFQNWKTAGCLLTTAPLETDLYHKDMGVENFARSCHFTSDFFQGADPSGRIKTPISMDASKVLYDLFDLYGILSSKRAGSLLGIYRSAGHLKGDSRTDDHYIFLPNTTTIPSQCIKDVINDVAINHSMKSEPHFKAYFDGYEGVDLWGDGFRSHGTAFDANYLFLDHKKNEKLARYGIYLHDAMRSLCFASFDGILSMTFDTPHIQAQLRHYGDDFLIPRPGHKVSQVLKEKYKKGLVDLSNLVVEEPSDKNVIYSKRFHHD